MVLSKFNFDDAYIMYAYWANDERVTKFLSWKPHQNISETKKILDDWIKNYKADNYYNWCIEFGNEIIGNISVIEINKDINGAEIGYCLGYNWWGKGIMPEAIRAVCKFLSNETCLDLVYAGYNVENQKSGQVLQKSGFVLDESLQNLPRFMNFGCEIITYSYKLNFLRFN